MSVDISITAYAGAGSEEFQKHLAAVKFCVEHNLSYPKETSEFFKGKVGGDDLEDLQPERVLDFIEDGVRVDLPMHEKSHGETLIYVADIPKEVDVISVKLS